MSRRDRESCLLSAPSDPDAFPCPFSLHSWMAAFCTVVETSADAKSALDAGAALPVLCYANSSAAAGSLVPTPYRERPVRWAGRQEGRGGIVTSEQTAVGAYGT
eukprot:4645799-Prorocentrum_lima.AAC.1